MFCPKCGTNQTDDLKFCKTCGANLQAVRLAVEARDAGEKFDWGKTWVAEMFLSEGERKRREEELERLRGITPEVKRYTEIKGGVITAFVARARRPPARRAAPPLAPRRHLRIHHPRLQRHRRHDQTPQHPRPEAFGHDRQLSGHQPAPLVRAPAPRTFRLKC